MIPTLYSKPNPPAAIIDAVANGDIDVAVACGPVASYFAQRGTAKITALLNDYHAPQLE